MEGSAEILHQPLKADSRITVAFVNADDDARKIARETASEYVRENLHLNIEHRGSARSWAGGIFSYLKFNLGEKYYKYQKAHEVEEAQIRTGKHFLTVDSVTGAVRDINNSHALGEQQLSSTASRFALAAEGKTKLQSREQQQSLSSGEINRKIADLLSGFAKGDINIDQFRQIRDQITTDIKNDSGAAQYIKEANFVGNNLTEIAYKVKFSYERGLLGLDDLDQKLDLQLGQAVMASTTDTDYSTIEKFMNWTKGGKYRGWIANPLFAGVAVSLATVGVRRALVTGGVIAATPFWGAMAPLLIGAGVGAAFAAGRRWTNLKNDRQQTERDSSYSKRSADPRRSNLEEFRYNRGDRGGRISFDNLKIELNALSKADLSVEGNRNNLLQKIAEIDARINYGIEQGITLADYANRYGTETQKLDLIKYKIVALDKIKVTLKASGMSDADVQREIDTALNTETNTFYNRFGSTQQEQDRRFNVDRAWSSGRAALFAAGTGLIGAPIIQEAMAVGGRALGMQVGDTVLENAWQAAHGQESANPVDWVNPTRVAGFAMDDSQELLKNPGQVELGDGIFLRSDGAGKFDIYDTQGRFMSPTYPVEIDSNGNISMKTKFDNLPDALKSVLVKINDGNIPPDIYDGRSPGFGIDLAQNLFHSGGQEEIASGVFLKAGALDPGGFRLAEVIDNTGTNIPCRIDGNGNITFVQDFNRLPLNIQTIFSQPGWQYNPGNGLNLPEFNRDKAQDFAQNYLKWGGRFGLNDKIDYAIDPDPSNHLGSADHSIEFTDKNMNQIHGAPMWQTADGRLIVAGDHNFQSNSLSPEVRAFLAGLDYKNTDEHNLYKYMQDLAKGELSKARDEVHKQGNFLLNTHDLHTGYLNQDIDPVTGRRLNLPFDEWAAKYGRIDPFTGQTEVGKMSMNFRPEGIWFNGFLQSDGRIHVDPNFVVDAENNNTRLSPDQWTRIIAEMRKEGWTVDSHPNGYIITPPQAVEYIAPGVTIIEPPPAVDLYRFDITPPPPTFLEPPPLLPTPLERRNPLGPVSEGPIKKRDRETIPYSPYSGYGSINPEQRAKYSQRRSERLKKNPNINLDPDIEIKEYLEKQDPTYKTELESYLSQEGMKEKMDDKCEAIVCIPVYTLGEGQNIQKTLEEYYAQIDKVNNKQAVDSDKFEVVLFLNNPKDRRDKLEAAIGRSYTEGAEERVRLGKPEQYDTEEVIRQFKLAHPELKIRVMKTEFPTRPIWGNIIKPLYDVALLRAINRTSSTQKDPVIITNDADLQKLNPGYINNILAAISANEAELRVDPRARKLDGWVGKIDMPNHGYENTPGFLVAERLYQFLDAQSRHSDSGETMTQGRNTILRASSYASIGGADTETDAGADTELGKMILDARHNPKTIRYLNGAWLESDNRRELESWQNGVPLIAAWNSWGNMDFYNKGAEGVKHGPVEKDFLETEIYWEMRRFGYSPDSEEMVRALNWIGLKPEDYHVGKKTIEDFWDRDNDRPRRKEVDTIIIDRLDGVIERVNNYLAEKRYEVSDRKVQYALNNPL